jgi:putative endonuclease
MGARTTRGRKWVLLHSEWFPTRREAMSREWHLKRDRKFRKKLALKLTAKRAR